MTESVSLSTSPRRWPRWWILVLAICLLVGGARWGDPWADRQLAGSVERAAAAFLLVRTVEAGLTELQGIKAGGSIGIVSGDVAPFAFLHPVVEMAERAGTFLFIGLVVLEGLRLLGQLMSSWAVDALLVVSGIAIASVARPWPAVAGRLWRMLSVVLVLRLALLVCALAVWPAQEMLQQRTASVRQRIEALSLPNWREIGADRPLAPSWWPSAKKSAVDPQAPRGPVRSGLDGLAADLMAMAGALAFELIVLPVLALMWLRAALAGWLPRSSST